METKTTTPEKGKAAVAINSLIKINNDRYEGYKTATEETKDAELKTLFTKLGSESKAYATELRKFISEEKSVDHGETTIPGKAFRAWMDFKAAITGKDRHGILASCEFGEDAALKVYDEVLEHSEDTPAEALDTIRKQRTELKKGHDTVKSLRDSAK